jgi:hypothetical protein
VKTTNVRKIQAAPTSPSLAKRVIDATTAELAEQVKEVVADVLVELLDGALAGKERPEWMTRSECAEYLRCSLAQLDILSRRDVDPMPFEVIGDSRRYCRADVASWIRMQRKAVRP